MCHIYVQRDKRAFLSFVPNVLHIFFVSNVMCVFFCVICAKCDVRAICVICAQCVARFLYAISAQCYLRAFCIRCA